VAAVHTEVRQLQFSSVQFVRCEQAFSVTRTDRHADVSRVDTCISQLIDFLAISDHPSGVRRPKLTGTGYAIVPFWATDSCNGMTYLGRLSSS